MLLLVRIITVQKLVAKCTVPFFIFVACLFCLFDSMACAYSITRPSCNSNCITTATCLFMYCTLSFLSVSLLRLILAICNSNCTTTSTCLFMYSFHFISVTLLYRSFLLSVQHFHSHLSLSLVLPVDTNIGITFHWFKLTSSDVYCLFP